MEASVTDGRRRDKEQLMAEMSRRKFLQHGSLGVAAAAALATVPNVARSAFAPNDPRTAAASTAGAAGVTGDAELATGGPVMVHLADARTGEIHLYVGERELTRHDPALAAAIARAARG